MNKQSQTPKPRIRWCVGAGLVAMTLLLFIRCVNTSAPREPEATFSSNECIIVAGKRVHVGTRVVTWLDPDGYSAYREGKHFDRSKAPDGKRRYSKRKGHPASHDDLKKVVRQFVLHYDACGCSRQCFKVLQDVRGLSVHFMLDVDGTIYQTLDVREKAWHATIANDYSVGIEIAHPGAWLSPLNADMRRWYEKDAQGWRQKFPRWMPKAGVRTEGFIPRPDRAEFVSGRVQGKTYHQFDFTPEQYRALPKLMAAINKALPRIHLEAPRDLHGHIVNRALSASQLHNHNGVLGHFHVQTNKQDPGPAFQWQRVLSEARAIRAKN
jgi:N-acetyl-anhydromuramyl-L-alanine amidase AmpD